MAFNLDDYEMVKDRIPLFYQEHDDGRITCDILTENADWVTMKAYLWLNAEEQKNNTPLATGIAREVPGGFIDKFYENAETSAIGRALANFNMFGGNRPSREEMESAQSMQEARAMKQIARPKPQAPSAPPPTPAPAPVQQQPSAAPDTEYITYCPIHHCDWFQSKDMRSFSHPVCEGDCKHPIDPETGHTVHSGPTKLSHNEKTGRSYQIWCDRPREDMSSSDFWKLYTNVLGFTQQDVDDALQATAAQLLKLNDRATDDYGFAWQTLVVAVAQAEANDNIWDQE